jgi:glycosyltransferase involved in cell wall biosynthesis
MIVTIVTPTLNGADYLRQAIESVQQNRSPDFEIDHVIVDAGSTDGTIEIAQSYGLRIIQGKDKGIFDAINKGSFNSSGDLLGFLGSDDLMLNGALEAIVSAYRRSKKRWVVGGIRWIDERGMSLGELAAPPTWMTSRMHASLGWNPIMHMSTYFSREFFTELNGFDISYRVSGDYELFARALSISPYERVSAPLTCFRRTGMNYSVVAGQRGAHECDAVLNAFGPKSQAERLFWRYVLKVWFNGRNPAWMTKKFMGALRPRVGQKEQSYF